jgi:hypothetical protein
MSSVPQLTTVLARRSPRRWAVSGTTVDENEIQKIRALCCTSLDHFNSTLCQLEDLKE